MHPHIPVHDLWWLAAGSAGYGARYVSQRWRALLTPHLPVQDPTEQLLKLQSLYGYNAHSLVSIAQGARIWTSPEVEGAIIYGEWGRVWLAAGDPLAAEEDMSRMVEGFIADAHKHHHIAAFVPATARLARATVPSQLKAVKVGAAPYFDLRTWGPRGNRAKKLRAGLNQARRAGVHIEFVERVDERLRQETAALCQCWLRTRRTATNFSWLLALDPFLHAERKRFFAARNTQGELVGFLAASPIPARDGWYLEDFLRLPNAPQGTADLLVMEALTKFADEGARLATLGTSPLARDGEDEIPTVDYLETTVQSVAARFSRFYNFEGIRRFKAKFVPTYWESEYALVPRGVTVPPLVTYAMLRAIVPGGLTRLFARQLIRMVKPLPATGEQQYEMN